jgi:hypothetical protein
VECLYAYPVFVGTKWQDNAEYAQIAADIQLFLSDLFSSTFRNVLEQYGFFWGNIIAAHFEGAAPAPTLNDPGIAQIVADLHAAGIIPDETTVGKEGIAAHAAIVYLDDTVAFSDDTMSTGPFSLCVAPDLVYGYHWFNTTLRSTPLYYGVVAPMTDACVAGDSNMLPLTQTQRITIVTSHEIAELISDPQPFTGWSVSNGEEEIADICEGQDATITASYPDGTVNTWTVQDIFSLYDFQQGKVPCVIDSGAPAWYPSDRPHLHRPRLAQAQRAGLALPLPATHRIDGKVVRKSNVTHRFARNLMAGLRHAEIHGDIPQLLREMADLLERDTR